MSDTPENEPPERNRAPHPDPDEASKRALSDLDRRVKTALEERAGEARAQEALVAKAEAARASGAAWRIIIDLVAATVLLGGLGFALDAVWQWSPLGLLMGLLAGFGLGMWLAARRAQALQNRSPPG